MDYKTPSFDLGSSKTRLVFSKNSTLNANLLTDGQLRYIVSTTDRHAQHTKVIDAISKAEIASVQKRTFLADRITLSSRQGGAAQKLANILQQYKVEDGHQAYRVHTEKGDFHWRVHPVYRLALYSAYDSTYPVAYRESVSAPIATFALVVQTKFEDIIDYIIPTFLVLEQQLRMGEKAATVAEATFADNNAVFGMYLTQGTNM